jgi:hypothetical protein
MAIRLDRSIIRGEIDNTERGRLRGKVWLVGRDEPLELDLEGDAWRDVAGTRIAFVNPRPRKQKAAAALPVRQPGIVGDITASRKVKQITASDEEVNRLLEAEQPLPFEWRNSLYIEWFTEECGRVIIESADYEIQTTEFSWQMDEAEEQAQQFANMNAMRNWLAGIIRRPERREDGEEGEAEADNPFSEEAWEASLKQSDRLTDAHMEALDKYGEDDDDESKVAYVMGWDHLLDALAFESEKDGPGAGVRRLPAVKDEDEEGEEWKKADDDEDAPQVLDLDDEWDDDMDDEELEAEFAAEMAAEAEYDEGGSKEHPVKRRAHELVLRLLRDLKEEPRAGTAHEDDDEEETGESPLDRFISNTMSISGKLAGALGTRRYAEGVDAGHTLAVLKRCLNWSNEALAGLNELLTDHDWEDRHTLFSEFKRELHAIRDGIIDLRKEIRDANPGV